MTFKARFGTKKPVNVEICVTDFAEQHKGKHMGNPEGVVKALEILKKDLNLGREWISDGTRNDFAVNDCIALWVLGMDPGAWFQSFFAVYDYAFYPSDIRKFMDHIERVQWYLDGWGPEGHREDALSYMID